MNKLTLLLLFSFVLVITACDKKPAESSTKDTMAVDSVKKDTVAVVPVPEMTGKAAAVAKTWKALEFETPTAKLTSDLVDIKFNFKSDGKFDYSEDGKKESGFWKVNEEGTTLTLEYDSKNKTDYDIKELKEDKMILTGKVHGMYRTYILAPTK